MPSKSPPRTPRTLLDALRTGSPLPDLPPDAVRRAQALCAEPATAPAPEVEALPEPLALALLEGSVLADQPALAEALAGSDHKALAKAAKKALYQLRSRGVSLTPAPPVPSATPKPAVPEPEPLPALLTSIDGTGERVLELARPLRGGGVETLQVLYSDEQGVTRVQQAEMSRADYRRGVKQATSPGPDAAVEISHAEALERLAAAVGLNLRTRTALPAGLDAALRHLGVQPRDEPLALPPPTPEDARLANEAHTLHDIEELRGWLPPVSELERLARTVAELQHSRLTLTPAQRNAELLRAAQAQAQAFLAQAEVRRLYARRLWEMALHFERLGQAHPALVARAEARELAGGAVERPSRFIERLYEKALLVTRARASPPPAQRAEAPAPARAEPRTRPPDTERRSPGGIILP